MNDYSGRVDPPGQGAGVPQRDDEPFWPPEEIVPGTREGGAGADGPAADVPGTSRPDGSSAPVPPQFAWPQNPVRPPAASTEEPAGPPTPSGATVGGGTDHTADFDRPFTMDATPGSEVAPLAGPDDRTTRPESRP
ncbi:hypothetical protein ACFQ0D_34625, partial [Micromonospora zhanjiangensis]